jgi:hypothetical protein
MTALSHLLKYMECPLFLDNGLFRFTQPGATNDEANEARPELLFGRYAPEDYEHTRESFKKIELARRL